MTEDPSDSANRVRQLNDAFRRFFTGGVVARRHRGRRTAPQTRSRAACEVRAFDAFNQDNGPRGEHDLGVVEDGNIGCPSLAASAPVHREQSSSSHRAPSSHRSICPLSRGKPPAVLSDDHDWRRHHLVSGEIDAPIIEGSEKDVSSARSKERRVV
jgi:hypothetical protein